MSGLLVTTSNSYTAVSTVDGIALAARKRGVNLSQANIAVVGATGAIGRAVSILLAEAAGRLILIGNPNHPEESLKRLYTVAGDLVEHLIRSAEQGSQFCTGSIGNFINNYQRHSTTKKLDLVQFLEEQSRLTITTDMSHFLPEADFVITTTSTIQEIIQPEYLKHKAIVYDTSESSDISKNVRKMRPDVLVIDGEIIKVPDSRNLESNFGLEKGLVYACMAETMMLGLEKRYEHGSLGSDIDANFLLYMRQLAEKHGFSLGELWSYGVPLTEADWQKTS